MSITFNLIQIYVNLRINVTTQAEAEEKQDYQ